MSSDVLIDYGTTIQSPVSNASDDSDVVNTETARVYFGPLQSPEKKFASVRMRTPLRRSTRLSSVIPRQGSRRDSTPQESSRLNIDDAGFGSSRTTPLAEHAFLPDEPSFVLASKVLCAYDNPSPPPSPPPEEHPDPSSLTNAPLSHIEESDCLPPYGFPAEPLESSANLDANNSLPDLINFDSFSTPSMTSLIHVPSQSPRIISSPVRNLAVDTVDDLLSISPQPSHVLPGDFIEPPVLSADDLTPSVDEEERVLQELVREELIVDCSSGPESAELEPQTCRRSAHLQRSTSPFGPNTFVNDDVDRLDFPTNSLQRVRSRDDPASTDREVKKSSEDRAPSDDLVHEDANFIQISSRAASVEQEGRRVQSYKTRRELGSLSPASAQLLMHLIPTTSDSRKHSFDGCNEQERPNSTSMDRNINTTMQGEAIHSAFVTPSSPTRPADSIRSPARRIPIAQAIAEGTFSPNKSLKAAKAGMSTDTVGTSFGIGPLGSPVFRKSALDDPQRSPAKRVPVAVARSVGSVHSFDKGKSPVRPNALRATREGERNLTRDLQYPASRRGRSGSAEPSTPSDSLLSASTVGKFFPQPSSSNVNLGSGSGPPSTTVGIDNPHAALRFRKSTTPNRFLSSVPELEGGEQNRQSSPTHIHPVSTFRPAGTDQNPKQTLAGSNSKIPRIGVKAQGMPDVAPRESKPMFARRAIGTAPSAITRPFRSIKLGDHNSDENTPKSDSSTTAGSTVNHLGVVPLNADDSEVKSLKRKRDMEPSQTSTTSAHPAIVAGRVVKGSQPLQAAVESTLGDSYHKTSGQKKAPGLVMMRRVADWKRPPSQSSKPSVRDVMGVSPASTEQPEAPVVSNPSEREDDMPMSPPITRISESSEESRPASSSPTRSSAHIDAQSDGARRSTRSRRQTPEAIADIFGTTAATRPPKTRRKLILHTDSSIFSGMTALALKALTSSNTTKNQHHVVEIKREVIRKEGKRPDSPTTKVRTALERQRELKAQQRKERADRRARRTSGADGEEENEIDASNDMMDAAMDSIDVSIALRHRRGPGDEEDYETPPRPDRPTKRGRLNDNSEAGHGKRVKWDKGLSSTVYLDDNPPKPRKPPKEDVARRGCLAPTAKSQRLDTLGNVLNAEIPLNDLVHEDVIVKKFVYDDDVEEGSAAAEAASQMPVLRSSKNQGRRVKPAKT
ncbi:uncharacterized protein FIBRA_01134 [Fibroporia radiculosa]|uniref:Uncharacterized protein n=1 Tax=Fibroporia radiculosa TaxID=599839 RepID=J4GJD9_9APHY|nr:uncharacterized protein FIBRA_01134 [Fibroporia radiculosa]CCL99120.1 predicted protein [Fibroporia radiculosa]